MPPKAYMYPLPARYYDDYRIRRYGAHGTSHRYAAQQAANLLGRAARSGAITCHLGNGGSITAVNHGKSTDTTMGFTPLEGLMMGTRSGSIDPAILTYIMRREGISFDEMDAVLNRESGVLGVSGLSADMRDVLAAADAGNEQARLAIDMYVYRVQKAIGGFYAAMTRTDAVVMTAGIGENSAELRELIFDGLAHMGMILDRERNHVVGQIGVNRIISIDDSPIKICVVTTDEEMRIARETDNLRVSWGRKRARGPPLSGLKTTSGGAEEGRLPPALGEGWFQCWRWRCTQRLGWCDAYFPAAAFSPAILPYTSAHAAGETLQRDGVLHREAAALGGAGRVQAGDELAVGVVHVAVLVGLQAAQVAQGEGRTRTQRRRRGSRA